MNANDEDFFRFDSFSISARERVLRAGGKPAALAPKAIDLLLVLLAEAGRVVNKQEIMDRVWPDGWVDESNLTQNIYVLRGFFKEHGSSVRIENVPKRGYRLIFGAPTESARETPKRRAGPSYCAVGICACLLALLVFRTPTVPVRTLDAATLSDYLLAKQYEEVASPQTLRRASGLFSSIMQRAPGSALGFAGEAETSASLAYYAKTTPERTRLQALAISSAREAVERDRDSSAAYAALGAVELSIEHDEAGAESAFASALRLNPNELSALVWSGTMLLDQGRVAQAHRLFARAVAIAPNSSGTLASLAWSDFLLGDYATAIAFSKQMLEAHQLTSVARIMLADAYVESRDFSSARVLITDLSRDESTRLQAKALSARVDALTGQPALAADQLRRLDGEIDPRNVGEWDAASIAAAYLAIRDRPRAFVWLARVPLWPRREIAKDPRFAMLVNDPRFMSWLRD